MSRQIAAVAFLLVITGSARADVSPLVFFQDPFVCVGALFIAIAIGWGGVMWSRHMSRVARKKHGMPLSDTGREPNDLHE
jgi:hypothetical protein